MAARECMHSITKYRHTPCTNSYACIPSATAVGEVSIVAFKEDARE